VTGPNETVGERLRRLRIEQGLSQRDLSSPGITYAYISRIEAGARTPSVKALRMLARKLGVTPEYLETGSDLDAADLRELHVAEQELRLRLEGDADTATLLELLADAETGADVAVATRARVALGFAAAARGEHAEVVAWLSGVVGSELVDPVSRPDVYSTLGRSLAASGSTREAVALFEEALAGVAGSDAENEAARVRYSTYLSYALTDLGELARARAVVAELFARSAGGESADPYTRVRLHWSLGRLSLEQAHPLAALDNFRRAVALLEATEDTVHLARAHVACADAILSSGEGVEAAAGQLIEAEALLGPAATAQDLTVVRRLQSVCAVASGDATAGESLAAEALALAGESPGERGLAWAAVAEARAAAGATDVDSAYREALKLLAAHGTVRDHAGVLRSYGRFLRGEGREREALDVFERAADVASNLQTAVPARAER
jgi:transcriptional regulator with XRE-family HTH domain